MNLLPSALRDVNDPANLITFSIPIHVVNMESLAVGVKRDLAFSMTIGSTKMWTALQEITIDAHQDPGSVTGGPTSATVSRYLGDVMQIL